MSNPHSKPPTRNSAVYARSSLMNDKTCIDDQVETLVHWSMVNDWQPVLVTHDEGTDGSKAHGPGLSAVLDAADQGTIDAVIVLSLDRIARRLCDTLEVVDLLAGTDVRLISVYENIDTSKPVGRLTIELVSSISKWEAMNREHVEGRRPMKS